MDLTQVLPEEILADVLRRVAPRGLAVCRCACKTLLAVIDVRHLLRADLLPLSVGSIFINFHCERVSEFFARPSTGPTISGRFDYVPYTSRPDWRKIKDHCNGLLLLADYWDWEDCYVVNPATRQWDSLPPRPSVFEEIDEKLKCEYHLVFDPMVSPHYEVFVILNPRYNGHEDQVDPVILEEPESDSEWPPPVFDLHVFSSKSGGWKERSFFREGEAAATVSGMRRHLDWFDDRRHAVYYRGNLYVRCKTDFVMRICLSNDNKYQVIKPPMDREPDDYQKLHLGRSEKGVYLATSTFKTSRLIVWVLEESCGHANWVLKHNNCLTPIQDDLRPVLGPWVLQDINFNEYLKECKERNPHSDDLEWLMEKKLDTSAEPGNSTGS
ncbi:uncharacterized protein LOC119367113 [Triticum dicoccoides]|uniref:uncharacterized protein LOC119367113 n=1 Tax=Triticum dicoccoides TaxID=85692 RepID=UPI0018903053|nr:uncharacterized protein LOC119367113 [Triticum dicoccoides]